MKKILILNTLGTETLGEGVQALLAEKQGDLEVMDTTKMDIRHCIGCNHCFLKTPGVCSVKDDYEQILRRIAHTQDLWLISGTRFGFLNYQGKRVMDRILPMITMNLTFKDGEMRHQLRYEPVNIGLVYRGEGNSALLNEWCQRAALNLGGHSLGAFPMEKIKEVVSCM